MKKIEFYKYHGLENDFLTIDLNTLRLSKAKLAELAAAICSRHTGIGADGVVYYSSDAGKCKMALYNADGSGAEVSGNGLRILAQHLRDRKLVTRRRFEIHTASGDCAIEVVSRSGNAQSTRIELSRPMFDLKAVPMRGGTSHFINQLFTAESGALLGTAVNVGNPHIVFFVDTFDFDWRTFGAEVEKDRRFPNCTNVEFAHILSRSKVAHCSWERGAGETKASGTGAAATVAAGVVNGLLDHLVAVQEPAGELSVELQSLDDPIHLTGPSVRVGEGLFLFEQYG